MSQTHATAPFSGPELTIRSIVVGLVVALIIGSDANRGGTWGILMLVLDCLVLALALFGVV